MAPSYNTIPTAAAEDTLLAPKKSNKIKGLVAGAALAAFVLGAVAATAVQATPAKEVVNLSKGGGCSCPGGDTSNFANLRECLDNNKGCGTITLEEGDFWLGAPQYALPYGTTIQGKGTDKTRITAANAVWLDCNSDYDPSQKIGFILGDNTNIQDFTYISLDDTRFAMDADKGGLCGGAVFEAPGCKTSDCKYGYKTLSYEGNDHISNAVISNIFITGQNSAGDTCWYDDWGNDDCATAPQSSLFIPWSGNGGGCTSDVTMTGVTMLKSWADGFNVHGCAHDIYVNHNTLWQAYQGDDNAGIWSVPQQDGPGLYNVFIENNDFSQVRTTNPDGDQWGSCVATYGFRDKLVIAGNVCRGKWSVNEKPHYHGGIMFSPVFCGGGDGPGHGGSSFENCKNEDMYPDAPLIAVTGTTFFDHDESGVDPGNEMGPDPSFILPDCGDVQWSDGGAMGYGWYCFNGGGGETYTDIDNGKSVTYAPDLYKVGKKWHNYADSCIHLSCNLPAYDSWAKMWRCIDDMDAASMYARDLAVAASRRGHLNVNGWDGDLFDDKKGGYFYFDEKKNQFCWDTKYDSTGELCYDYDYTLNPDVKMWNSNRNGYYKISVDPDSQSLQFYCMESGSDKLTTDC